jgi:hypothetical protein
MMILLTPDDWARMQTWKAAYVKTVIDGKPQEVRLDMGDFVWTDSENGEQRRKIIEAKELREGGKEVVIIRAE